jgi:HAD superfamily hydrolase (TIGR01549 family)
MIKAVVFDFDGVLAESVDIKTRAFIKLFKDQPEYVLRQIKDYHILHGGISRYEKFRYYYKNLLKEELTSDKKRELSERFSQIVLEEVIASPWVAGAKETLDALKGRVAMFVASGTPHEELILIIEKRGMKEYFSGVYGIPDTKAQILMKIIEKLGITPDELVMVGDAMSDFLAAKEVKARFIGRTTNGDDTFVGKNVRIVSDLSGVSDVILGLEN